VYEENNTPLSKFTSRVTSQYSEGPLLRRSISQKISTHTGILTGNIINFTENLV